MPLMSFRNPYPRLSARTFTEEYIPSEPCGRGTVPGVRGFLKVVPCMGIEPMTQGFRGLLSATELTGLAAVDHCAVADLPTTTRLPVDCDRCRVPVPLVVLLVGCYFYSGGGLHAHALLDEPPQIRQGNGLRYGDFVDDFSGHVLRVRFELTKPFRALD